MTCLIFIEGVSGVGKSTTAKKLCEALNVRGDSADCYLEGNVDNPVDLFCCACLSKPEFTALLQNYPNEAEHLLKNSIQESDYVLVRYADTNAPFFAPPLLDALKVREGFYRPQNPITPEQYTQVYTDCWRRFISQNQVKSDYMIFDGSFLYHRANDLIQNYNATNGMIASHLTSLLAVMSPYGPLLYYLSSEDVGERLAKARESRGQTLATAERIAFEEERKNRQMQILGILPIQAHIIDVSDENWSASLNRILEMLDKEVMGI
ncbi:hypothetical protein Dtox_0642 [Desulfofarcimen acetoxidans DSM 771]|uniref:Thymidylate kinase-like domain-containing protein n=1 Tax=Desulfofarcimen acetoxidans (strain ATCC 49208 / DSM 771 / KCTC 5769 / VKM B-1644 / 5575) TaxID=485916 RepID=C8W1B6_DESAS|nr:hypothetical protein [Desulfofarcimen acetoxidans]ACV61561.1 hypothetical protein Dtox_0642 [Desulfofarcimen acetoxidans DSM 771]